MLDERINILEGTDFKKSDRSKECDICHYWYSLDKKFNYEPYLCNDLMMLLLFLLKEVIIEFIFGI